MKSGGLAGHARLDAEAGLLQTALQLGRATVFVVARFGILPDGFGSLDNSAA
jgi:hypothetical protein